MFLAQYEKAVGLITMPLWAFHRLADEVGSPEKQVGFIFMSSRCGSTLLTQALNRVPKTRCYAEPIVLNYIQWLRNKKNLADDDTKALMKSCLWLLCHKQKHSDDFDRVIIKTSPYGLGLTPVMVEVLPKAKVIFNSRNLLDTLESLEKVRGHVGKTSYFATYSLIALKETLEKFVAMPFKDTQKWLKLKEKYVPKIPTNLVQAQEIAAFGVSYKLS